ncbi:MAG: hypothetical protein ABG776_18685, partial [Cyanobacteria bacterium J06555_13]
MLSIISETIQNVDAPSRKIRLLKDLAAVHKEMGNIPAQQAAFQQAFSVLETSGPSEGLHHQALYSLSYSYEHTLDQTIASAMFEQLEAYTRQSGAEFDGQSGALSKLVLTALSRGNE